MSNDVSNLTHQDVNPNNEIDVQNKQHNCLTFDQWISTHQRISEYIQIMLNNSNENDEKSSFSQRRANIHERTLSDLKSFESTIEEYGEQLQSELDKIQNDVPVASIPHYIKESFTYKKLTYIQGLLYDAQSSIISRKLYLIMERQADINSLSDLLRSNLIPDNITIAVSLSFFTINWGTNDTYVIYLSECLKRLIAQTPIENQLQKNIYVQPLWLTNFPQYFSTILNQAKECIDQKLFYMPHMEFEESLYQCILELYSKNIDDLLKEKSENRPDALFKLCQDIIPNKKRLSQLEKSISLLMLFRVVFELVTTHVKNGNNMEELDETFINQKSYTDQSLIEKVIRISKFPIRSFSLPDCVSVEDPNMNVREFFRSHELLKVAADEISQTLFASNPIDTLFGFHKSLSVIDEVYRNNENSAIQTTCFDDMFSLFFGAFLASDTTDVFFLSNVMNMYLAQFVLCPPFEYALTTVEALVIHIKTLDISKLDH
ncbi:hypothetical protein M9Y10_033714 [Tritrichomonas musculus]|uniref:VPS9 domain-containing protein n=1 Tax=Tritrichomonas musculus TaxID=1915356 RepID=A0ABR2KDK7_9EUKA